MDSLQSKAETDVFEGILLSEADIQKYFFVSAVINTLV